MKKGWQKWRKMGKSPLSLQNVAAKVGEEEEEYLTLSPLSGSLFLAARNLSLLKISPISHTRSHC